MPDRHLPLGPSPTPGPLPDPDDPPDPGELEELDTWAHALLYRPESGHALAAAEALARLGPESIIAVLGRAGPASIDALAFTRLADVLGPQTLVECLLGPRPYSPWVWHGALEYLPARVPETRLRRVLEVALTDATLPATVCARALDLVFRLLVTDRSLVGGLVRPLERRLWAYTELGALRWRVLDLLLAAQPAAERPAWSMRLLARAREHSDWPLLRRVLARLAPADVTPRCARRIEDLLAERGVPDSVRRAAVACLLRCSTDPLEPLLERCLPLGAVPALLLFSSPQALAEEVPTERLVPLLARGLRCVSHALAAQLADGAPAAGFPRLASWLEEAVELLRALQPGVEVSGLVAADLELRAIEVVHFRHRGAAAFAAAADILGVAGSGRAIRVLGRHLEPGSRATVAERLLVQSAIARIRARVGAGGPGGLAVVEAAEEAGRLSVSGAEGTLTVADPGEDLSLLPEQERWGPLAARRHGWDAGPLVLVLHGGPAAAGSAGSLARGLGGDFRVLEPFQRGSGDTPLTVAQHVEDLRGLVQACIGPCGIGGARPALVGESWGAMLALAYAAAYPDAAGPLVLVGCGTFDPTARNLFQALLARRLGAAGQAEVERIEREVVDARERLRRRAAVTAAAYAVDPLPPDPLDEAGELDERAHAETWADMLARQADGTYPAAFAAIRGPVLMLHGADDPHPGELIRDGLRAFLPQLEYREWPRCGHSPWRERGVRADFFRVLIGWLEKKLGGVRPRVGGPGA